MPTGAAQPMNTTASKPARTKPDPVFSDIVKRVPGFRFDVMFDVGANVGQTATRYAAFAPDAKIHAFEPIAQTFKKLSEAVADLPNVTANNFALGRETATMRASASDTSVRNRILPGSARARKAEDVRVVRGSEYCRDREISSISFLKIDTEGHDLAVLEGFGEALDTADFVQVEASFNPGNAIHVSFRVLEDYLREHDFLLFRIYEQVMEFRDGGRPYARRGNPVFVHRRVARPLVDRGLKA
jgi:FkbM family methyltransferase